MLDMPRCMDSNHLYSTYEVYICSFSLSDFAQVIWQVCKANGLLLVRVAKRSMYVFFRDWAWPCVLKRLCVCVFISVDWCTLRTSQSRSCLLSDATIDSYALNSHLITYRTKHEEVVPKLSPSIAPMSSDSNSFCSSKFKNVYLQRYT